MNLDTPDLGEPGSDTWTTTESQSLVLYSEHSGPYSETKVYIIFTKPKGEPLDSVPGHKQEDCP